uniref:(northern house mosquito) hypothetical protein n=1 Tax=Culex pipiens TaxID=7175 RepID=A0A8D8CFK5_CULPI
MQLWTVSAAGAVPVVQRHLDHRTQGILDDAVLLDVAEGVRQRQLHRRGQADAAAVRGPHQPDPAAAAAGHEAGQPRLLALRPGAQPAEGGRNVRADHPAAAGIRRERGRHEHGQHVQGELRVLQLGRPPGAVLQGPVLLEAAQVLREDLRL